MTPSDLSAALRPVLDALAGLGVRHFVAGSIASSAHDVPRASIDADVVAELQPGHGAALIGALANAYYVPVQRVADAIRQRMSFNVIHLATMVKVDVFVAQGEADQASLGRVVRARLDDGTEVPICSAEDSVLAKLHVVSPRRRDLRTSVDRRARTTPGRHPRTCRTSAKERPGEASPTCSSALSTK